MDNDTTLMVDSDHYIFQKPLDQYDSNINPIKDYIKHTSFYIHKIHNIPIDIAKQKVIDIVKQKFINPMVNHNMKDRNGDMLVNRTTLSNYLKELFNNNGIVTPSLTKYKSSYEEQSVHAVFLNENISNRKKYKKEAFKAKQQKDIDKFIYYDTLQIAKKVFNNSLSGSYSSQGTVLYNTSAHYTLTSLTRAIVSIGNTLTESFIGGNKHLRDPNTVMNYITVLACECDRKNIEASIFKYNLHIPTAIEVLEMIKFSSDNYYKCNNIDKVILEYLKKLDDIELCAVMYTNDLWHLAKHNNNFIMDMINNLQKKVTGGTGNDLKIIHNASEGILMLSHFLCVDELKGVYVNYDEMKDTDIVKDIASTTLNIINHLKYYKLLFKTFYTTDILPISISHVRDMMRDVIVLSDTDSTCGSYDKWVKWYRNQNIFNNNEIENLDIKVSSVLMTLNTQLIDHFIKQLAKNMNIDPKNYELLKMKNEYYWSSFVTTNSSKHYYASALIREGNVYTENELDLKGSQFISSRANKEITKQIHKYVEDITKELNTNNKIDIKKYVTYIANLERSIIDKINKNDISIFKYDKIKNINAYAKGKYESPYFNHILWEEVFSSTYGSVGEPIYMVIVIPTILKNKSDMDMFIDNIENQHMKNNLIKLLKTSYKKILGTFRVPISIAISKGIPKEIIPFIDTYRVINDNCNSAYLMLESIGFYKKPNRTLIDLGY